MWEMKVAGLVRKVEFVQLTGLQRELDIGQEKWRDECGF
jgi:hypothetical protein